MKCLISCGSECLVKSVGCAGAICTGIPAIKCVISAQKCCSSREIKGVVRRPCLGLGLRNSTGSARKIITIVNNR